MIYSTNNIATSLYSTNSSREPKKELDKNDFLSLLVTQLKYQDPLNPLENNEFIAQTTQFSSLEQLLNISEKFDELIDNNNNSNLNLYSAVGFIDKKINFYGNKFSAGEDGAELKFELSGEPKNTVIKIYDDKGAEVNELSFDAADGENIFRWDLTDKNGVKLHPGYYSYDVEAKDTDGNEIPVRLYSSGKVIGILKEGDDTIFDLGFTQVKPEEIVSVYN